MNGRRWASLVGIFFILVTVACGSGSDGDSTTDLDGWSEEEVATLRSLWIDSLPPLPPDPSNAVADDPRAARLGQHIFFDPRFSVNGGISCASCHQPERLFTDGLALGVAIGRTDRKTMTIVGTAYSPWLFWDGRSDSLWAQALVPLESAVEHGGTRAQYAHLMAKDAFYRAEYEALFGPLPDMSDRSRFPRNAGPVDDPAARAAWAGMTAEDGQTVSRIFANIGKALAAYERLILPGPSRFDAYVEAVVAGDEAAMEAALTPKEVAGLRLFIGPANCTRCHNGPLLTNNEFHNTGVPPAAGLPLDRGRVDGVEDVIADEFNCLGPFSDAEPEQCDELRFVKSKGDDLLAAFKVPTLRNVAQTAPYMHAGQFATLSEVLEHYNRAVSGSIGHNELEPLNLSETELEQLEAFLHSLDGPLAVDPEWLAPPE